jgi:hypothetical protein
VTSIASSSSPRSPETSTASTSSLALVPCREVVECPGAAQAQHAPADSHPSTDNLMMWKRYAGLAKSGRRPTAYRVVDLIWIMIVSYA